MAKLVSKVYGDALFEAARDCGKMDEIFEEVQSIGVILEENASFRRFSEIRELCVKTKSR